MNQNTEVEIMEDREVKMDPHTQRNTLPSLSCIFAFTLCQQYHSVLLQGVMVFPVKVFTNICIFLRFREHVEW